MFYNLSMNSKVKTVDILIGIIGSGKTTLAKELQRENGTVILSIDEIREELVRSEKVSSKHNTNTHSFVYEELRKRLKDAVEQGRNVIIDATNTIKREQYFQIIAGKGYKVIGRVLLVEKDVCVRRVIERQTNDSTSHFIDNPEKVADFMINEIKENFPTLEEGFDELIFYKNGNIAEIQRK